MEFEFHRQQQQQQQQQLSSGDDVGVALDMSAAVPPMTVPWLSEVGSLEDLERELIAYASSGDECPQPSPFSVSAPAVDWQWLAAGLVQDPILQQHQTALDMAAVADLAAQEQSDHEQQLFLQNSGSSASFGIVPTSGLIFDPQHLMHSATSSAPSDEDSGHMSDASASAHAAFSTSPSSSFPDLGDGEEEEDEEEDEEGSEQGGRRRGRGASGDNKPFSQPRPFSRKTRGNFLASLTDEERRLLAEEGYEFPEHDMLTKEEERRLKSLRRKIKNKLSAQDSRKKRKDYMSGLEGRVKVCSDANKQLKNKVETLEAQNRSLLDQLREMKESLERMTRGSTNKKAGTALMIIGLCFAFFLNPASMSPSSAASQVSAGPAPSAAFAPSSYKSRTLMSADGAAGAAGSYLGEVLPEWLTELLQTQPGEIPPSFRGALSGARGRDEDESSFYVEDLGGSVPTTEFPPIVRPSDEQMAKSATDEGEENCDDEGDESKKKHGRGSGAVAAGGALASSASARGPATLGETDLGEKAFKKARLHMPAMAHVPQQQSLVSATA